MQTFKPSAPQKRILLLQGPPSAFSAELGQALLAEGAQIWRINFCFGDWLFWRGENTLSYRGKFSSWEEFLENFVDVNQITDIVYFADRFPYHRVAQRVAARKNINAISFEYGYLRPDWVAVEPGGQSAFSHFTTDLKIIRKAAQNLENPDLSKVFGYDFSKEANGDVIYHLSNYLLWFLYPFFRRDRVYNPIKEYLSYIPRNRRASGGRRSAEQLVETLASGTKPYFILPLQMQNDYQIRCNSPYSDQRQMLGHVLRSFKEHAANDAVLVVKIHPLDNGLENWQAHLDDVATQLDLVNRIKYLDGGDLNKLTASAKGMVTINSTSGLTALKLGCPLIALGIATFDIEGLTHQGQLDKFWQNPFKPTGSDVQDFIKVLAKYCHVRGNFYGPEGRQEATKAFAQRLTTGSFPLDIFPKIAPRLAKARAMGIPIEN